MVSTSVCGTEKNSFILFFFLYVRNAVAHCAAVSAGFTFFRLHPKVERSSLLFAFFIQLHNVLQHFFHIRYCECVLPCAYALRRATNSVPHVCTDSTDYTYKSASPFRIITTQVSLLLASWHHPSLKHFRPPSEETRVLSEGFRPHPSLVLRYFRFPPTIDRNIL